MINSNHTPEALAAAEGSTWDLTETARRLDWEGIGIAASHHRDSDPLDESNWISVRGILFDQFGKDNFTSVVLNHWLVGWVEFTIYNSKRTDIRKAVLELLDQLAEYPVLDENLYSDLRWEHEHSDTHCFSEDEECPCGLIKD